LLGGVIQSVTQNGRSLIWVAILGLVIFYLYALVAFAFFRDMFNPSHDPPSYCSTLFECTVSFLRYGLMGDYNDGISIDGRHKSFASWSYVIIFKLSFFIIVTTIGLNIIFGIIVDTFSELRNKKYTAESDMKDTCFICGIGSYDFEHKARGFVSHVKNEHNMWAYMYYLIYLHDTESNDYTALDMYVANMINRQDYDFFPMNRALSLTNADKDSTDSKIDELLATVQMLVAKQREEEFEKRRQEERRVQKIWQEEHRQFMRAADESPDLDPIARRRQSQYRISSTVDV
jgi:inositol 1,4,5-triphosphate receptor type 1